MASIKDPIIDPNKMIQKADYDIKAVDAVKQYGAEFGINSSMLGWNPTTKMITMQGKDFMAPSKIEDGRSIVSNDEIRKYMDEYSSANGLKPQNSLSDYGYKDTYTQKIDSILDSILNPKAFNYNAESDPSFQVYRDIYNKQGDKALANTMSEASSLTGGRLNSWAVSAGQQAKSDFDSKLTSIIPQLEQLAYSRYTDGINNQRNNLNTLMAIDNDLYRKAYDERNFKYGEKRDNINDERYADETQYNRGRDTLSDVRYDKEWKYNTDRDMLSDKRYEDETKYNRSQDDIANQQRWEQLNLSKAQFDWNKSVDERNLAYQKEKLAIDAMIKTTEKDFGIQDGDLALAWSEMMNAEDPVKWLIDEAANGMPDTMFKALHSIQPKDTQDQLSMIMSMLQSTPVK